MDLAHFLAIWRRRWFALILCVAAGAGAGYYRGHHTPSLYQATSRSLIQQPNTGPVIQQLNAAQLASQFIGTYAKIAQSRAVATKVVTALDLPESPAGIQGRISATIEPATYIIDISATDGDPARAQSLANTAAVALAELISELEAGKPDPASVKLLDSADLPGLPISPKPTNDLVLGLLLGTVLGVALIATLEALDRSIKTSSQGDAAFLAPLLALIPKRRGRGAGLILSGTGTEGEPYRALRTAVQFANPDVPLRTILVTSASAGEGKTTTAANLALALAASGDRVVIIDADLRRARLAGLFGLEGAVGLSSLVLRTAELDDALQDWNEQLTLLPSGRPLPPNPSEVLGSQFMTHVLNELAPRFDVVILDTPPVLPVTDAVALAALVDAVLLVARHGSTHRAAAAETRRRLDAVGAHVIGYVLNAVPARESTGYYADYHYQY